MQSHKDHYANVSSLIHQEKRHISLIKLDIKMNKIVIGERSECQNILMFQECSITFCLIYEITLIGLRCSKCIFDYKLIDGHCISNFYIDEYVRIGCSLCIEGYTFNFNLETCEYMKPQIQNCLRSFINFSNQEVCTLSSLDFNIAPEIINCEKYKPNCLQCVLSPESIIKCVICKIGYASSATSGDCYEYQLDVALIQLMEIEQYGMAGFKGFTAL